MVSATHIKLKGEKTERLKAWCASREINYLETAGTTGTTETAEKFIIILMILCFAVVSFVSVVSVVSKKPPQAHYPNFLSEGVRFGSDTKTGGWDILEVFPIRQFD